MTKSGEIDPIAWPPIDPQFQHTLANGFDIAEVPDRNAGKPRQHPRARFLVSQPFQPFCERLFAVGTLVVPKLDRGYCNL